ncbi:MAG: hypothetical protein ACI8TX_001345 [Hyphomicrobiaceae bacterium]|jgi:hypothetical protein
MSVNLQLFGFSLRLESELPAFEAYVRTAMKPWLCEPTDAVDVRVGLRWHDSVAPRGVDKAYPGRTAERRPDRDLLISGTSAVWGRIDDFSDLTLEINKPGDVLEITGDYYFQIGSQRRIESLRRLLAGGDLARLQSRRFSTLLYYLVYHPLLWRASRQAGWNVLHAGGVARGGRGLVFVGAPGCGKSTLCVSLLADREVSMLSDNLLLHDGARVLACPELMLLDERSLAMAGPGAKRLVSTGERRVFGRDAYRPDVVVADPVRPAAICYVERGGTSSIEPIDADEVVARIHAGNTLAKEVRRIAIMNEVLDLVAGTRRPNEEGAAAILASGCPAYRLQVGADGAAIAMAASLLRGESN